MNRIEKLRKYIDKCISSDDSEGKRSTYVHLYSVSQNCAFIASKRNLNPELATLAGMLHDIYTLININSENHATKGALLARQILNNLGLTNNDETELICNAIHHHSNKEEVHSPFDEMLKDADVLNHLMHDITKPIKQNEESRCDRLSKEFCFSLSKNE